MDAEKQNRTGKRKRGEEGGRREDPFLLLLFHVSHPLFRVSRGGGRLLVTQKLVIVLNPRRRRRRSPLSSVGGSCRHKKEEEEEEEEVWKVRQDSFQRNHKTNFFKNYKKQYKKLIKYNGCVGFEYFLRGKRMYRGAGK